MSVSKTSSKKLAIRKHVFSLPKLSDRERWNGIMERGDTRMASYGTALIPS